MKASIIAFGLTALSIPTAQPALAADNSVTNVIEEARVKAYELLGKDTLVVSFATNSADISDSEQKNIVALVTAVRNNAVIASAMVAGWADKDYPSAKGQQLSKAEQRLAEARIAKVKKSLIDQDVKSVETHSMAEHPSWLLHWTPI